MTEERTSEPAEEPARSDAPPRDDGAARGQSAVETFFRPVVEDEGLRPVVAAVFIGLWTVLGWGLLLAVRDLHPAAILAVLALGVLSIETMVRGRRQIGRIGIAGWCLVVLWLGAVGFAIGGAWTGYL